MRADAEVAALLGWRRGLTPGAALLGLHPIRERRQEAGSNERQAGAGEQREASPERGANRIGPIENRGERSVRQENRGRPEIEQPERTKRGEQRQAEQEDGPCEQEGKQLVQIEGGVELLEYEVAGELQRKEGQRDDEQDTP